MTQSHKRRVIDRLIVLKDFSYYKSLNYLANYKDWKRPVDKNAQKRDYVRKRLIEAFRIRQGKSTDYSRIFNIITHDLFEQLDDEEP